MTRWLSRRPVRVALLLLAVWLLNGFDLFFTIWASRMGPFQELNPLAAMVLGNGNYTGIILYKAGLVLLATGILWYHRHYSFSETGCWMITFVYAALALRWHRYYETWNYYCHHDGIDPFQI